MTEEWRDTSTLLYRVGDSWEERTKVILRAAISGLHGLGMRLNYGMIWELGWSGLGMKLKWSGNETRNVARRGNLLGVSDRQARHH